MLNHDSKDQVTMTRICQCAFVADLQSFCSCFCWSSVVYLRPTRYFLGFKLGYKGLGLEPPGLVGLKM